MKLILSALAFASLVVMGANAATAPEHLSTEEARAIAADAIELIDTTYVIEDKAHEIASALREKLEAGDFDVAEPQAFASALSAAMREISHDLHMSFRLDPERYEVLLTGSPNHDRPSKEQIAYYENQARQANYGYKSVQFLPGNIGYINLTGFGMEMMEMPRCAGLWRCLMGQMLSSLMCVKMAAGQAKRFGSCNPTSLKNQLTF